MPLLDEWNQLVEAVEKGWLRTRRSSPISLLPKIFPQASPLDTPRIEVRFTSAEGKQEAQAWTLAARDDFEETAEGEFKVVAAEALEMTAPHDIWFDGLRLTPRTGKKNPVHTVTLRKRDGGKDISYEIVLQLQQVALSPVQAEDALLRSAQRDMSAREVAREVSRFSANCGPDQVVVARLADAPALKIECVGDQPGRDTVWIATLLVNDRYATSDTARSVQLTHAPFMVAQTGAPRIVPEAGGILAQWRSDDADGAQWRFGVETVALCLPPQAVGEAMVRGARSRAADAPVPMAAAAPIGYRYARRTELTVKPSRKERRYTVHPGDLLSILRDAELEGLVTELAYPLELRYQRSPELRRTIVLSEVGSLLGEPAVSLPARRPETVCSTLMASYLVAEVPGFAGLVEAQRGRQLAARASFRHRIAQFPLADAKDPERRLKLNLREGLSAHLRSANEGAGRAMPLPAGAAAGEALKGLEDYLDGAPGEGGLPVGLLYSLEFAAELAAVLRNPSTAEVQLAELTLSVLGASGSAQAAFDEGRTVFDVVVENGQLSRLVKTRHGRIGAVWNKARHVVVYERSVVPGAQFQEEQRDEWWIGRPLLRKMEEYVEILEPRRLFESETGAAKNKPGCLHAFHFASRTIYVNGAWGRDLAGGYEIPLYNPLDTSGFYPKPWMGPVLSGGGGDLAQHWCEEPEQLVFYTSTEPGKGADSDAWAARLGVDLASQVACFGLAALAADPQAREKQLEQRHLPSYHLDAASNPRFALRVRPEGLSNLMHGRGAEELVAAVRTVQVERTLATARLDLRPGSVFAATPEIAVPAVQTLWPVAKAAADLKSIDASIRSILADAATLWKSLKDAGSCAAFKSRLKSRVEAAFGEAGERLGAALDTAGGLEAFPAEGVALAEAFGLLQRMPDTLVDNACAEGERAIGQLRARLAEVRGTQKDIEERWERIEQVYLVLPLRALLRRAGDALHGPGEVLCRMAATTAALATDLGGTKVRLLAEVDAIGARAKAVLDDAGADLAKFRAAAIDCMLASDAALARYEAELADLRQRVAGMPLPPQLQFLHEWREGGAAGIAAVRQMVVAARASLALARAELDTAAGGIDAVRDLFKKAMDDACLPLKSGVGAAFDAAAAFILKPQATLAELAKRVKEQAKALRAGGPAGTALHDLLAAEAAAFQGVAGSISAGTDALALALGKFDGALAALQAQCAIPGIGQRAPLATEVSALWNEASAPVAELRALAAKVAETMKEVGRQVRQGLADAKDGTLGRLEAQRVALNARIDDFDCQAWSAFAVKLEDAAGAVVEGLRTTVLAQAERIVDAETRRRAEAFVEGVRALASDPLKASPALRQAWEAVEPRAGQAIKLARLLSDPPALPQLTIRTDRLECVYDDLRDQIATSPFVARVRELDAGIKELGLALPSSELFKNIVPDPLQGLDFSRIIRNVGLDFQAFFSRFKLPALPEGAIRITHHVDPKTRSAEVKAEINHEFASTEALFDIASFSLDVRKPRLVATSDFEVTANEAGKARTNARFSGDWILNFGGQPIVTFVGANIQYSEKTGFRFDLDPSKIEPHPSLKFISDLVRARLPALPENVEVVRNGEGAPVGARIAQEQTVGPLEFGGVSIGETVIASRFGLRLDDGRMQVDTAFALGRVEAPAFIQIGTYGGGGWLTVRAWTGYENGELKPQCEASIGISLGSAKAFSIASVAYGSYALRFFVEASFRLGGSGGGASALVAGLQLSGSARILGYLSAYLNLLVQIEHQSGGQMKGRGRLDVRIKVCWCYTVRVSRSVEQNM